MAYEYPLPLEEGGAGWKPAAGSPLAGKIAAPPLGPLIKVGLAGPRPLVPFVATGDGADDRAPAMS